jgi:hypothetical protein
MLSAAKHLDTQRDRPFAAAQGDTVRHLRLMPIGSPLQSLNNRRNTLPDTDAHRCQTIATTAPL